MSSPEKIYGVLRKIESLEDGKLKEISLNEVSDKDWVVYAVNLDEEFNFLSRYHQLGLTNAKPRTVLINDTDSRIQVFKTISEGNIFWEGPIKAGVTIAFQKAPPQMQIIRDMALPCKYVVEDRVYYGSFALHDTPSARDQSGSDIFIPNYYELANGEVGLNAFSYPFSAEPVGRKAEKPLPQGQSILTIYTQVTKGEVFETGEICNPYSHPPVVVEPI